MATLVVTVMVSMAALAPAQAAPRPHIVLIVADDLVSGNII